MRSRQLASHWPGRARAVLLCAAVAGLGACPDEPCHEPNREVVLAGPEADPNLGTFRGQLLWLQTGQETELRVRATPEQASVEMACERGVVDVAFEIDSADGVLSLRVQAPLEVERDGRVRFSGAGAELDTQTLAGAGKLPEAPDLSARFPHATLTLLPEEDGSWSAVVAISTSTDYFNAAVASLLRDTP